MATIARRKFKKGQRAKRFVERVGVKIKDARGGRPQRMLAKKLDVDVPTVSRIESGERDLRLSELFEVGAALGVPPYALVSVPMNGEGGES